MDKKLLISMYERMIKTYEKEDKGTFSYYDGRSAGYVQALKTVIEDLKEMN